MSNENDSPESQESDGIESDQGPEETHPIAVAWATPVVAEVNHDAGSDPIDVERREASALESKSRLRFPDFEPENETFPWQVLPETIRGAVIEICKNDKLAVPIAAQAVLSAVSLACQDLIMVDRGIGDISVCSLFMLTVTDTGARKSKADGVVTSSIEAYDRTQRREYAQQIKLHEYQRKERQRQIRELEKDSRAWRKQVRTLEVSGKADNDPSLKIAKGRLAEIEQELADLNQQDFNHREPRLRRVFYSKIPIRELELNLAENWPAAGLFSDEAAGILNARGEADMASLDKLWDGKAIDVVGRTARETVLVEDPRLTISLMVQPIVFDRFLVRKGELAKGIGFMSRVLLSRPNTPYGKRKINTSDPRLTDWIKLFNDRIKALLAYAHSDMDYRDQKRKTLYFAPAAQQAWERDFNEMEDALADGGKLVYEREFVNRYSEHVARLAALFYFFENGKLTGSIESEGGNEGALAISEPTVTAAMRIVEWYLEEYKRVFNPEVTMREMASYVLKRLKGRLELANGGPLLAPAASKINCRIPFDELRENCSRFGLKDAEGLRGVLLWLEKRGNLFLREKERRQKETPPNAKLQPEMVEIAYMDRGYLEGVRQYQFFFEIIDHPKR
jgi:Protein of unknown function (DUF3987)